MCSQPSIRIKTDPEKKTINNTLIGNVCKTYSLFLVVTDAHTCNLILRDFSSKTAFFLEARLMEALQSTPHHVLRTNQASDLCKRDKP